MTDTIPTPPPAPTPERPDPRLKVRNLKTYFFLDEGILKAVDGVGVVVAESVAAWFADEDNLALLTKFKASGVKPVYEVKTGNLTGKKFVVTGTLESMGRDIAAERIRAAGGTFQSSVGKDTDYLVAGGKVGASKLKKAEAYGTKILNEQEFLALL